jgi:hypothetical protein
MVLFGSHSNQNITFADDHPRNIPVVYSRQSLKIPKGQSESVYRRRTNNTITKRKSTKGQTTIYNTYT